MLKINIQQAIDQVDEKYWTNQKNGKLTKKNAQVFEKYYGLNKLLNDVATEDVRNFKVHCKNVRVQERNYKHKTCVTLKVMHLCKRTKRF